MHPAANQAIACAVTEIQRDGFRSLETPHFNRFAKKLRQLGVTKTRLDELRHAGPAAAAQAS